MADSDCVDSLFAEILKSTVRSNQNLGYEICEFPPEAYQAPRQAINLLVRNFNMVIALRDDTDGSKVCFSLRRRNHLPGAFVRQAPGYLGIMPDDMILWANNTLAEPQEAQAREVIFGDEPVENQVSKEPKPSARAKAKWMHPDALSQAEMDLLTGKTKAP